MVEWEVLVAFTVDDHNRDVDGGCQADRADFIEPEPIEEVHEQNHHGGKEEPENPVLVQIETSQGLFGAGIACLQEQEPDRTGVSAGSNDRCGSTGGMSV